MHRADTFPRVYNSQRLDRRLTVNHSGASRPASAVASPTSLLIYRLDSKKVTPRKVEKEEEDSTST